MADPATGPGSAFARRRAAGPCSPLSFAVLLVVLAALAAYGTSLANDLRIDDGMLIVHNHILHEPRRLGNLLSKPYLEPYYRPLVFLSFFLEYQVWGPAPLGYHLTNLLLHLANALLLLFLIRSLFGDLRLATLTAVLFALHPLQFIPVNYIADRGNLLAALLCLGSLLLLRRGCAGTRHRLRLFLAGYLCFILALFSRENAFLFPLYAALLFFVTDARRDRSVRLLTLAVFAAAVAYFILRKKIFFFSSLVFPPLAQAAAWRNISTFSYIVLEYVRSALVPGDIHMIREIALPPLGGASMVLFPLCLAGMLLFCLIGAKRKNAAFFAGAWFLISVLPLYGFMFSRPEMGSFMQDNQVYLASAGLFLLMAFGLEAARRRLPGRLGLVLVILLCAAYTAKSVSQNLLYHDKERFLKEWIRLSPRCDLAAFYLGQHYQYTGRDERAIAYYKKSLIGNDARDAKAFSNMGNIALQNKDRKGARRFYANALNRDPTVKEARLGLANVFIEEGDLSSAERLLVDAGRVEPDWPYWRLSLVNVRTLQGRHAEAELLAKGLTRDFPSLKSPYYMLVWLNLIQGDVDEAFDAAEKILLAAPDPRAAFRDISDLFGQAGCPLEIDDKGGPRDERTHQLLRRPGQAPEDRAFGEHGHSPQGSGLAPGPHR